MLTVWSELGQLVGEPPSCCYRVRSIRWQRLAPTYGTAFSNPWRAESAHASKTRDGPRRRGGGYGRTPGARPRVVDRNEAWQEDRVWRFYYHFILFMLENALHHLYGRSRRRSYQAVFGLIGRPGPPVDGLQSSTLIIDGILLCLGCKHC